MKSKLRASRVLKDSNAVFRGSRLWLFSAALAVFAILIAVAPRGGGSLAARLTGTVDLSLVKLISARPLGGYRPGLQITYQLTVSNAADCKKVTGTSDACEAATGVTVKDLLPVGLTFVSANPSNVYDPKTGIWTVSSLDAGANKSLQIVATINTDAKGSITNYAEVQSAKPNDIDSTPGNNSSDEDDDAIVTIAVVTPRSSIAGNVYVDGNDNGARDQGEAGIGGVTIALTGTDSQGNAVSLTTTTATSGQYIFSDLLPGTYKLTEAQPLAYVDGKDAAGTAGGTLADDMISNIQLGAGVTATGYNFGEHAGAIDLAITKSHTGNFTAGGSGGYTLTVRNVGNLATSGEIVVTDSLPAGMTFSSGGGTGWSCAGGGQTVTCTRAASLAPNASATISLIVNVSAQASSQLTNTASVATPGDVVSGNNTASDPTNIVTTPPPTPEQCGSDGASILLFPLYTSDAANPMTENTRITMTNTHQNRDVAVHLFFVDGATCNVSDGYTCLTQNQTISILMSDLDPGTTGYIVAVASDDQGCPISFNHLVGQAEVKLASGHVGTIAAERYPALYEGTLPGCDSNTSMASLRLDGVIYGQPASQLAVPMIPSLVDGNNPLLVLVRTGGNLAIGAAPLGSLFGILYNDAENAFSFSISSNTCQIRQVLSTTFPRTAPRITQVIPAGRTGWMRIGPLTNFGIAGAYFNNNTNPANVGSIFNGGINLPRLRCGVDSYTIPIFPPSCL
jgi:uncharacterized repeat protein (TIGR01451 family)